MPNIATTGVQIGGEGVLRGECKTKTRKKWGETPFSPSLFLALVVQTLDSTIHRINRYPVDKYYENQLCYPLDSDLTSGKR